MKHIRYSYEQEKELKEKLTSVCNGYYTELWHGFINYYDKENNERIGYEAIQDGYYFIDRNAVDCEVRG